MPFKKYQHVERFGSMEVAEIVDLNTPCHVFPKLDGTNASVWCENGELCFGSRNRQLSLEHDNAGFMAENVANEALKDFFREYPNVTLYGEWLVPHTLKTYSEDAWRKFHIFDVAEDADESGKNFYWHYGIYKDVLESFGLEVIPCMAVVNRGTEETFLKLLDSNVYLMQQGEVGEGIVIKRYNFKNKHGRTTWAKIVRNDFKAKHLAHMGPQKFLATGMVEESIVEQFLSEAMIEKVYANIVSDQGGWDSKFIPRLLNTVYYDLVREESWAMVKKFKHPTINFGSLQRFVVAKVKEVKSQLF